MVIKTLLNCLTQEDSEITNNDDKYRFYVPPGNILFYPHTMEKIFNSHFLSAI